MVIVREIKFRAWIDNEMLSHERLIDMDQETHAIYTIITDEEEDDSVFMQYIGLKDKNSTDIYEGDVIRSEMQKQEEDATFVVTGTVTYFTNYAQFLIKTNKHHPQIGSDLYEFDETEDYQVIELEVIGNIYENPELFIA